MSKDVNKPGDLCAADYAMRDMRVTKMTRVGGNGQPGIPSQHYTVGKKGSQASTDRKGHKRA